MYGIVTSGLRKLIILYFSSVIPIYKIFFYPDWKLLTNGRAKDFQGKILNVFQTFERKSSWSRKLVYRDANICASFVYLEVIEFKENSFGKEQFSAKEIPKALYLRNLTI